jgi:hypothetical protein
MGLNLLLGQYSNGATSKCYIEKRPKISGDERVRRAQCLPHGEGHRCHEQVCRPYGRSKRLDHHRRLRKLFYTCDGMKSVGMAYDESRRDGEEEGLCPSELHLSAMPELGGVWRKGRILLCHDRQERMHHGGERLYMWGLPSSREDATQAPLLLHQGFRERAGGNVRSQRINFIRICV